MAIEAVDRVLSDEQLKDHWVRRGVAYIIDTVFIVLVTIIIVAIAVSILFAIYFSSFSSAGPNGDIAGIFLILTILMIIALILPILYWIILDAKGGTLGKRILKLKPQALEGKMGFKKSATRNLSKIIGGFLGGLIGGFFIAMAIEIAVVLVDVFLGINKGGDPRMKYTDYLASTTVARTDISERFAPFVPKEQAPSPAPQTATTDPVSVAATTTVAPPKKRKFPIVPVFASIGIIALIIMLAIISGIISPQSSSSNSSSSEMLATETIRWEDVVSIEGDIAGGGPLTMIPDVTVPFEVESTVIQMDILLTWSPQTMDLDLIVRDPSGDQQGTSGNSPGTPESVRIKGKIEPGTWTAEIDPFAAVNVHYTLEVTFFHEKWNVSGGVGELLYKNSKSPSQETSDDISTLVVESDYNELLIQLEVSSSEGNCIFEVTDPDGNVVFSESASGSDSISKEASIESMQGGWTVSCSLEDFTGDFVIQIIGM